MAIAGAVVLVVLFGACSAERPRLPADVCPVWQDEIADVFRSRCGSCHGAATPQGGYDTTEYLAVLGGGSDPIANAIAGDPSSTLLQYLDPDAADPTHAPLSEHFDRVRTWVVDCDLAYGRSLIHAGGIMNPADEQFHGRLLAEQAWNFDLCARCHGEDLGGGTSGAGCVGCHERGPTDCLTCHGPVPDSGAHRAHADPASASEPIDCAACHRVPRAYDDPGHLFRADGSVDPEPAEVEFGELARQGDREREPTYDPVTGRCQDVYCHGATFDDVDAGETAPVWTAGSPAGECGACHGVPPANHAHDSCTACHGAVASAAGAIATPALHVDGAIRLGDGSGECTACHRTPADLAGREASSEITVGAHQSHLEAAYGLRGPMACNDCHAVPEALADPGHIDSAGPAEVFPPRFAGLATAGGAEPVWDRDAVTCRDVYCHGGGTTRLAADAAPGLDREPVWTAVGADHAACGACHGVPPLDGLHDPTTPLTMCADCHPATVDPFGNIILNGPPGGETSEHIDGTFDF